LSFLCSFLEKNVSVFYFDPGVSLVCSFTVFTSALINIYWTQLKEDFDLRQNKELFLELIYFNIWNPNFKKYIIYKLKKNSIYYIRNENYIL